MQGGVLFNRTVCYSRFSLFGQLDGRRYVDGCRFICNFEVGWQFTGKVQEGCLQISAIGIICFGRLWKLFFLRIIGWSFSGLDIDRFETKPADGCGIRRLATCTTYVLHNRAGHIPPCGSSAKCSNSQSSTITQFSSPCHAKGFCPAEHCWHSRRSYTLAHKLEPCRIAPARRLRANEFYFLSSALSLRVVQPPWWHLLSDLDRSGSPPCCAYAGSTVCLSQSESTGTPADNNNYCQARRGSGGWCWWWSWRRLHSCARTCMQAPDRVTGPAGRWSPSSSSTASPTA